MSITIDHRELHLDDLDTDSVNIRHAYCDWCYPDEIPPDAKYICGKEFGEAAPEGAETCIVCDQIKFCQVCERKFIN